MKNKTVLIGAGSAVFSLNMIKDICLTPGLAGSHICLMDINEERLQAAYQLCTRYAQEMGMELLITRTTDREEALEGAEFVINTALGCSQDKIEDGCSVAEEMGYHYGGSLHVMHDEAFWINFGQFRLIEEIYLDTRRIAPDAWYILLANPVLAATTMLGRKYHDPKVVGLCEGPTVVHDIFQKLGFDEKYVSYELAGCNHFTWMTKLRYRGEDAFPLLDRWIEEHRDDKEALSGNLCLKVIDMYETFGVLPVGDTHSAGGGSYGWWYHSDRETEQFFREDPAGCWAAHYGNCRNVVEEVQRIVFDPSVKLTEIYPPIHSQEVIIDLIEALALDAEKKIVVNIMNENSLVPGVPTDFCVEVAALCNKNGISGICTDGLPRAVLGHLLSDRIGMIEVELQAHENRDEALLVDLVMMDHQTKSRAQAEELVDRILNRPWNGAMFEYYRGSGAKRGGRRPVEERKA